MPTSLKLWENGTPCYDPAAGQPETVITPYLVDGPCDKGFVIVCPGGGYFGRSYHEGEPIAKMFNDAGISAAVLDYRVRPYHYPAMLLDANRAVRFTRFHASDWQIDPHKIAILGFSAGGHLAVSACEHYDNGKPDGDEIDRVSSRPDAGLFCYAVVTLRGDFTHTGTRDNFLGDLVDNEEMLHAFSGEEAVPDDAPPAFLWHTAEDEGVPFENSLHLAEAWHKKGATVEMHIYPHGRHGLGLAPEVPSAARWAKEAVYFLKELGF